MMQLEEEITDLIITTLDLEGVDPADIDPAAPLFGDGLGLDSIDALELGVALQKKYGLKIDGRSEDLRQHFHSVRSLAAFVASFTAA
ncbi:phosphopantetheine-binding protein [Sphingosinicellaceae bacterium A1X5R2]|uniref:phosphopantetheine-binding protein n=1 Tax=Pedomonas mirosovicensis TaxID=2908641 RepID=UPI0021688B66|nr:phosphopantetheine-binding protein [Pedomonas mirosovicensis]